VLLKADRHVDIEHHRINWRRTTVFPSLGLSPHAHLNGNDMYGGGRSAIARSIFMAAASLPGPTLGLGPLGGLIAFRLDRRVARDGSI
jgi:hypothetical protein